MSGNDYDPIWDRVQRILDEARPGPGVHLTPEEIDAFARVKPGPDAPVPEHLGECPWCWCRVFEARKVLARERVRARRTQLRVPVAFHEWAVQFLAPVPGMRPAYAFSAGMPAVREMPAPRRETPRIASSAVRFFSRMPRLVDPDPASRARFSEVFEAREESAESPPQSPAPAEPPAPMMSPAPASMNPAPWPEPVTVSFPLPVKGFDCRLTVTREGERCALVLAVHAPGTGEALPGAVLSLEHEGGTITATTDESGTAFLSDIPLGGYDLCLDVPPTR